LREFENRVLRKMIRPKGRKKSRKMEKIRVLLALLFVLLTKYYQHDTIKGGERGSLVLNVCREDKCVNYLWGVYGGKRLLKKPSCR
jgi:hypothetical protein